MNQITLEIITPLETTSLRQKTLEDRTSNVTGSEIIPLKPAGNENVGVSVSFSENCGGISMRPFIYFHIAEKEQLCKNFVIAGCKIELFNR